METFGGNGVLESTHYVDPVIAQAHPLARNLHPPGSLYACERGVFTSATSPLPCISRLPLVPPVSKLISPG